MGFAIDKLQYFIYINSKYMIIIINVDFLYEITSYLSIIKIENLI